MLSKIRLYNEASDFVELPIGPPGSSGFYVDDVTGLGPVKADVSYTPYTLITGAVYHSSNIGVRNIVIKAGFEPRMDLGQSVESLRSQLYTIAPPGKAVKVYIYRDGVWTYWIEGVVETNEPTIFTKDPMVQLSILCVAPYFKAPDAIVTTLKTKVNNVLNYEGSAPRGFTVDVSLTSDVTYLMVRNEGPDGVKRAVQITKAMTAGQTIRIQLVEELRYAAVINSAGETIQNLVGYLEFVNGWPELNHGQNVIYIGHTGDDQMNAEITYRPHYRGV